MNFFEKIIVPGLLSASWALCAVQPYDSIRQMQATPYYVQDSYAYYQLASANQASVIVDVESQDGGVARFFAQQTNNLPSLSQVYSVSSWVDQGSNKHLYHRFLSNVMQENTSDMIIPVRMSSQEAASSLNVSADLISLVGGNDADEIYNDILAWYPHLSEKGVICGDNWSESAIEMGVTNAASALDLSLKINANLWYLERNL